MAPEVAFRPMRDSGDPLREALRAPKDLEAIAESMVCGSSRSSKVPQHL